MLNWLWRKFNKKKLDKIKKENNDKLLRLARNCEDFLKYASYLVDSGDIDNAKLFHEYYKEEFIKFKKLKGEN